MQWLSLWQILTILEDDFRKELTQKIKTTSKDFDNLNNEDNPNMTKDTKFEDDLVNEDTQ